MTQWEDGTELSKDTAEPVNKLLEATVSRAMFVENTSRKPFQTFS
jgi:hypothetical protein